MSSIKRPYYFKYSRIRVDLGEDVFVDSDVPNERMFEAATLKDSARLLLDFVNSRKGQVIDVLEDGTVEFDTCDLTCFVQLEPCDQISEEDLQLLAYLLVSTQRTPDSVL